MDKAMTESLAHDAYEKGGFPHLSVGRSVAQCMGALSSAVRPAPLTLRDKGAPYGDREVSRYFHIFIQSSL